MKYSTLNDLNKVLFLITQSYYNIWSSYVVVKNAIATCTQARLYDTNGKY